MKFGETLQSSIYEPWRSNYIDYSKLKQLLRDDSHLADSPSHAQGWTEEDEIAFVDELVNVQLEKVNAFHNETYKSLRHRTADCEAELQKIAASERDLASKPSPSPLVARSTDDEILRAMREKLDTITKEMNELEKYSRLNYTGFLKAAKKHDRKRGPTYRVRPLLQVRLAALPFNSEDYSPLLYQYAATLRRPLPLIDLFHDYPPCTRLSAKECNGRESGRARSRSHGRKPLNTSHTNVRAYTIQSLPRSLTGRSLGASGEPAGGENLYPPALACTRLQPTNVESCRRRTT